MKIQTTRDEILNKILFINRAMSPKISNFILNGIMMEAQNETLNIYGTDLETSINSRMNVKVIQQGRVVVPSKILINVLRSFPEAKLDIELLNETNELSLTCQKANFKLNTFALEEYPQFPEIKNANSFKIDFKTLKYLISKVQKSCSSDESRVILTGILMDINKNYINLVATDSYRLSVAGEEITYNGEQVKVVIPERVLDTITKSDLSAGSLDINIEENQISFVISESAENKNFRTTVISRLLSGKFPDYSNLIPQDFKHSIIMNRAGMLEVIKRVSSISQDNIPIKLDFEKGKLVVSMNIRETGSSVEDLDISYGEETLEIAFNPEFLIEGLNIMDDEKIIFDIVEPLKPIMIKPEKNKNLFYLLMPIRIS
jgi:DNA polymerase-3 subunit beta